MTAPTPWARIRSHVSPTGVVTSLARELSDPQGIAVDQAGALYVAETALHRIMRIVPTAR